MDIEQPSEKTVVTPLIKEQRWLKYTLLIGLISVISGCLLTLLNNASYWVQINLIGHTLLSTVACLPFLFYLVTHTKRVLGIRQIGLLLSGIASILVSIALIASGIWIAVYGKTEVTQDISTIHFFSAYCIITLLFIHCIFHVLAKRKKQKRSDKQTNTSATFTTITVNVNKLTLMSIGSYLLVVSLLTIIYEVYSLNNHAEVQLSDYQYDYGEHPFRPSQTETVSG